ncbi:uncharacterized protein A4U43_C09F11140 [Asparagus officinalis]|uniref:Uncharacterized protein n=1 Tax=Asparagus officinalis TaxID=4686 RepID=A0A5P1E6U5_ASPOF|nr:uncharacterized protein A4U43_C09F11140 [Asparagus officinalis]
MTTLLTLAVGRDGTVYTGSADKKIKFVERDPVAPITCFVRATGVDQAHKKGELTYALYTVCARGMRM